MESRREVRKRLRIMEKQGEKLQSETLYITVFHFLVQNQRGHGQQREKTKARLTAVAVKPNFLKNYFKGLTLLLLGV